MQFMKAVDNSRPKRSKSHKKWKKKSVYTTVEKETIISYINIVKTDGPVYLKQLKELEKISNSHSLHVLVSLVSVKKWKTDKDFFKDFEKFISLLINKADDLINSIKDNLPDNYNFYSTNLNVTVSTFLLYLIRFPISLSTFLDNVAKLYDSVIDKKHTLGSPVSRTNISRTISDFNYIEATGLSNSKSIDEIIESIGDYPSGDNLSKNVPMSIKQEIISGVVGDNKIGKVLTNFISSFKTATDHTTKKFKTATRNKNVLYGFSGNPIYYIRKIIADLEISGYEKRKLERKRLELRMQYLKEKANKEMDPKRVESYKKQVEILESKIERIEAKEKAFIDKLERKK